MNDMTLNAAIQKIPRHYMPVDFTLSNWKALKPFFEELNSRVLDSAEALEVWLKDVSEVRSVISEDAVWRQKRINCDT